VSAVVDEDVARGVRRARRVYEGGERDGVLAVAQVGRTRPVSQGAGYRRFHRRRRVVRAEAVAKRGDKPGRGQEKRRDDDSDDDRPSPHLSWSPWDGVTDIESTR